LDARRLAEAGEAELRLGKERRLRSAPLRSAGNAEQIGLVCGRIHTQVSATATCRTNAVFAGGIGREIA